ncbi:MAG: AsmA family protein [Hyphomicrobiaceae bacterium]
MPNKPPPPSFGTYRPRDERRSRTSYAAPPGRGDSPFQDPRRQRTLRRRRGWIRLAAEITVGVIVLCAVSAGLFAALAPLDAIRDGLVQEVKARTGRDLRIAGRTSLSFWPRLAITMENVSLSAPPAMGGAPLVRMRRLDADPSIMALLMRQIEIDHLTLTEPVIELRIDANGRRSWDFAALASPPRIRLAQAGQGKSGNELPTELKEFLRNSTNAPYPAANSGSAPRRSQGQSAEVNISELRIVNGTIRYQDDRNGHRDEVKALDTSVQLGSLAGPLSAQGQFLLHNQPVGFQARLNSPVTLAEHRTARLALQLAAAGGTGRFEGTLRTAPAIALEGAVDAETRSLRELLAFSGLDVSRVGGLATASVKGKLGIGPASFTLNDAQISLDGTTATGEIAAATGGSRPLVTANLQIGRLDLDRYTTPAAAPAQPGATPAQRAPDAGAKARQPTIEDLIRGSINADNPAPGTQVKGFVQRRGWSEEPIDARLLNVADLDMRLALAGMSAGSLDLGATRLLIKQKDGGLRLTIEEANIHGGVSGGIITLGTADKALLFGANITLDSVACEALTKQSPSPDTPWLSGKAKVSLALGGRGMTERQIVDSLNGKIDFVCSDGMIVGYDVSGRLAALGRGQFSGFEPATGERTPFSEAGASFTVTSGTARSTDIRMTSPSVNVTGSGTLLLGPRELDISLRPSLTGRKGDGVAPELAGLEVPIRIHGSWDKPEIVPDVDAVLKNPDKAIDAVDKLGRRFGAEGLGDALRGFLGRGNR